MDAPGDRTRHAWRAAAGVAVAILAIAVAGFAYLDADTSPTNTTSAAPALPLSSRDPVSAAFVTPRFGWAVVNPVTPPAWPAGYFVFRTTDGGNHWEEQLHGQSTGPGFIPITVRFFGLSTGYMALQSASGADVYRTDDGGDHWQPVGLPRRTTVQFAIADPRHLCAVVEENNPPLHLYESGDGGHSWRRLPDPPADASGLAFRGPAEAWMGSFGQGAAHAYFSGDDGGSWRRRDVSPPSTPAGDAASYRTEVELLPAQGVVATTSTSRSQSAMFTSFDAGASWDFVPLPSGRVAFDDADHWWSIGQGLLFKTDDAGHTWRQQSGQLPDWGFVPHVLDLNHAWAEVTVVGGFGLAMTNDGGFSWIRLSVPQPFP